MAHTSKYSEIKPQEGTNKQTTEPPPDPRASINQFPVTLKKAAGELIFSARGRTPTFLELQIMLRFGVCLSVAN